MKEDIQLRKNLANLIELLENDGSSILLRSSGIWTNTGWHREAGSIDACELLCFFEGSTVLNVGERTYTPRAGEIYCCDLSEKSYCEPGTFKTYYITLACDSAHIFRQLQQGIGMLTRFQPFPGGGPVEILFQQLLGEEGSEKAFKSLMITHLLSELFVMMYRQYGPGRSSGKQFPYEPGKGRISDEVMKILNSDYQDRVTLADIGTSLSLNPRYINSVFKEINGITIRQHLIRIRLGAAKKLLKYTSMHVTDIALETGFSDCQHFCRSFNQHEGITPLDFRKRSKT